MKKTEVYILSGFLGSGKTTLLTRLLQQEKENNRKVAVVMNEVGQVSIDSNAVPGETPLKELLNGCVCCSLQDEFEAQLQTLLFENELDVIYIETTGVAHPIEVIDACLSPLFAKQLSVKGIVSLIDAMRWINRDEMSLQAQKLLAEQVVHADFILINKIDLLTESQLSQVIFNVQNLNPSAKTLMTEHAKVNIKDLQNMSHIKKDSHQPVNATEHLNVKTFVYEFKKPVRQQAFEDWLRSLGDNIYRIKGYIKFEGMDHIQLFQYSYGVPIYLPEEMNLSLTMVFIGENLNHDKLKVELEQLEIKS
jgi:G3E family GTPase